MAETIAILFIFFVLLVVGMVFFYNVKKSSIEQEMEVIQSKKAVEIALKANHLNELRCSEVLRDNCFDILKIKYAKEIVERNIDYYFDTFGFSRINIQQIYPVRQDLGDIYHKYKKGSSFLTRVPILLYNPLENEYQLGVINVETYY